MPDTDLLRASRDGDQFHYHWAARQALKLLLPGADLTAIAIEGVSHDDTEGRDGEDVIDIAEYYGATGLREANRVVYRQLKHSTTRATEEWTVSGLAGTVSGFAEKFRRIRLESPELEQKVTFEFLSNRPVRDAVLRAIGILAAGGEHGAYAHEVRFLRQYAGFSGDADGEATFFNQLQVDPMAPGLLRLEGLFRLDLAGFLPGAPDVQPLLLKEMIARRATSLEMNHVVDRSTVLTALGVPPERVLPAPNLIGRPGRVIVTPQTREIVDDIVRLAKRPVIVHAAGGVGKSVLTTQIERNLPEGSVTLVYDCFGNGDYRRASSPRHQHQQGLVQLANELAAHALCDPLIPAGTAQPADYGKAFIVRVYSAAEAVAATTPGALLVLVVDAADNAALIARDGGERTFVADLLRETLPVNVRLVMLCRTERVNLLEPPPGVYRTELAGFGVTESMQHLESVFGAVTEAQAAEFHRRTGGNPRIQALVLSTASDLDSCLASLGEAIHPDVSLFDELLQSLVDHCKDANHHLSAEIDRLCEAMAALRPRIPVRVLTELCGVPAALIHSFAADLGRSLLVDGDTLQFRDEPTETWFRTEYRPTGDCLIDFIDRLTPLAAGEPYVAASLPQLLWEAGQVDTLVELAMTDGALPEGDDLEQREIAQQRVQFALKATLRVGKEWEAARLAVKAGSLAAGHSRRLHLLRCNTDLAGAFLDASTVEGIVANRSLAMDWPGSNLHFEGALLSFAAGQTDFARSRLRSAAEWLQAWVRQPDDGLRRHRVTATDIAEVAFGLLNTDGVEACVGYLARWRPNRVGFDAGVIITTRLADSGRTEELEALGHSVTRLKYLQFAVAYAAWQANLVCQAPLARRLVRMLKRQRRPVSFSRHPGLAEENKALPAVGWIIAMGLRHGVLSDEEAERILRLNLPDDLGRGAGSRYGSNVDTLALLCGFALLSKVRRQPFDVDVLAGDDVLEARQHPHTYSSTLNDHKQSVVPLGAWASLWIDCLVGASGDTEVPFRNLVAAMPGKHDGRELPFFLYRGVARLGIRILAFGSSDVTRRLLLDWYRAAQSHIADEILIDTVRAAAPVDELQDIAIELAESVAASLDTTQESAEYKAEQMVKLARAVQRFDTSEAHAYFTRAIDLTDRVGDDVHVLWRSFLAVARRASEGNHEDDRRAYRVAQLAESLQPYLGDGMDHSTVLSAMGHLNPRTATVVAARWRDRRLCSEGPFIQALLDEAAGPLAPSAVTALAMVPFGEHRIGALHLVERALREAPDDGEHIAGTLGEHLRARRFSSASLERLDQTASELDIDLSETLFAGRSRHITFPASSGYSSPGWTQGEEDDARVARARQLEDALTACDLSTDEGWEKVRQLVHGSDHLLRMEQVIDRAVSVPLRELGDMLAAFQSHPNLSTFDYQHLLKGLAERPLLPQAARRQLRLFVDTVATRFSRELTTKGYEPIDLQSLADLAGTPDADLLGTAIRELGSQPAAFLPEECHHLAARLAPRLTGVQAQVVLDDFGTMLTALAPEDSGDGVFTDLPARPAGGAECLAGYLWAVLGDPEHDARWRAAHSVRLLVELGCKEELDALQSFALGTLDVTSFHDARLPFYSRHALQWLLFALARAAQNTATHQGLAEFEPLLRKVIFEDGPHVVMQESAKAIYLALASSGSGSLTADELDIVRGVNTPKKVVSQSWAERRARTLKETDEGSLAQEPSDFHFFWDFGDRWCKPLGEAFGISEETVLRLVGHTITDTWQLSCRGTHEDDPRHTLKLYREGGTFAHQTNWPDADDLDFYLSTHALWTVAGELLKTHPVYRDSEADTDLFTDWLGEFLLARDDGRWLADRRDPSPQSVFSGQYDSPDPDWIWQLNSQHFSERLLASDGWVTVWEDSDDTSYQAAQEVLIHSALVTPERARALALALQTAPSYMAYRIPNADDSDYQFDAQGFQLTGWIVVADGCQGQDNRDPLAAGVRYPPYRPAEEIVGLLRLKPDADMREWNRADGVALRSAVWDDTAATSSDRVTGTKGHRLEIRSDALLELLALTGRSMIVEVMIDRTHKDHRQPYSVRYDQDDDESLPPHERSYKIYLFDESGGCSEL
ncbi:hypothetical protein [Streptomyces sp. NBC_01089]|uniref:hypothetical protein n=1 Tax=Streptomyces sp. NBC_01089 TaxID=2903747 RepID=UPI003870A4ED|nr:hypothetical protein OG510_07735 [Streptomyces sp. NBC_01089]